MSIGSLLGTLALNAVLGGRMSGSGKKKKKYSVAQLMQTFGEMAFLPSEKISAARIQQGYKGGVNPITPYKVINAYTGGRVRGLFIGINYRGTRAELHGCINDVTMLLSTLDSIKFPLQEACILVDDPNFKGCSGPPTRENIIKHMQWLVHDARPGDVFFFHYSGHGSQTKDRSGDEEDGLDETLVPLDYQSAGCIIDDDIHSILVSPLPQGARLTAVVDCCHSGTIMDLPYEFEANAAGQFRVVGAPKVKPHHAPDVVMFSGCSDEQTSADVGNATTFGNKNQFGKGSSGGAATNAFSYALLNTHGLSYVALLGVMRDILKRRNYVQTPQMSATKPIEGGAPFSLFGALNQPPQPQQPAQPAPSQQMPTGYNQNDVYNAPAAYQQFPSVAHAQQQQPQSQWGAAMPMSDGFGSLGAQQRLGQHPPQHPPPQQPAQGAPVQSRPPDPNAYPAAMHRPQYAPPGAYPGQIYY